MNSQYIDIIVYACVAIFLVFRLRAVLGRRTGTERPPAVTPSPGTRTATSRHTVPKTSGTDHRRHVR